VGAAATPPPARGPLCPAGIGAVRHTFLSFHQNLNLIHSKSHLNLTFLSSSLPDHTAPAAGSLSSVGSDTEDSDLNRQWADAMDPAGWEGSDPGGALGTPTSLQSLSFDELAAEDPAEGDTGGLASYRAASSAARAYAATPAAAAPGAVPVRAPEDLSPQEAALEEYYMSEAVDYGMWLHHERQERSHSRYASSIRFGQLLEEVESEDVRRGVAPLVPGTGLKMPSWIRASEALVPEIDDLNAVAAAAEIEASARELVRMREAILEEGRAARQLVAITDPFAGISADEDSVAPEAIDELFGDPETMLPGATTDLFASDLMDEIMGMRALEAADLGGVERDVIKDALRPILDTVLSKKSTDATVEDVFEEGDESGKAGGVKGEGRFEEEETGAAATGKIVAADDEEEEAEGVVPASSEEEVQ
jgi:hypothetical protein